MLLLIEGGLCLSQDWLTDSARLISKAGHTVQWVTPLGLPIIQPYHRTRSKMVSKRSDALWMETQTLYPELKKKMSILASQYLHDGFFSSSFVYRLYSWRYSYL